MTTRVVETDRDKAMFLRFIEGHETPFTVTIAKGKHRSTNQNRLMFLWYGEIAQQTGMTVEEVRGYCKLRIGVPILRAENETFREAYDRVLKGRDYDEKLACMIEPLDMPITRFFTTKQGSAYLDQVHQHWTAQGIQLTIPDWGQEEWEKCRAA